MYPANTSNPEFAHEWVPYTTNPTPFGRQGWRVCKRCGKVMRADGKVESCLPSAMPPPSPVRGQVYDVA